MNDRPKQPKLNFPAIRLQGRREGDRTLVWDPRRAMWLVLTPEEWVRQHLVAYLISHCGVQPERLVMEYPVEVNGQSQRADVVVVDGALKPLLVAECKAPDVTIDEQTLSQAVRYNAILGARYLVLTNGLRHYCYEQTDGTYRPLAAFPKL